MEHARLAPEAEATLARALQSHMEGLQASPSDVEVGMPSPLLLSYYLFDGRKARPEWYRHYGHTWACRLVFRVKMCLQVNPPGCWGTDPASRHSSFIFEAYGRREWI